MTCDMVFIEFPTGAHCVARHPNRSFPHSLEGKESDSDSQGGADAEKNLGAGRVEEIQQGGLEGELVRDEHCQEEQGEADDGKADLGMIHRREQLGEGPGAEKANRKAADIPIGHHGIAKQENKQTGPPREVEKVADGAHG